MNKSIKTALAALVLAALVGLVPSPALTMGFTPYGVFVAAAGALAIGWLSMQRIREAKRSHPHTDGPVAVIHKVHHLDLALFAIIPAFVCARLAYCLARFSFYFVEMGPLSVLRTWEGGFMLYGAALGALLGTALLAKRRGADVAATLDEIACPGLLAVAVCRLGEFTAYEGVGAWIENPALMRLPFAVCNEYGEWQLAVFLWAAAAALILLGCMLRVQAGRGERILSALLLYACCQVMLESLRMDSCLKIGFVRVSQVISAVVILGVTLMRARRNGGRAQMACRAVVVILLVALIGGIEWALDKTATSNVLLYALMIAACAGFAVNGMRFEKRGLTD
ncbi:MAG: prolipoprotein diacylglyceryl transferase [Clostridia bacterium]|nr:prolipoprotein diacylglyceryl transferase [Clostridia bacterium]